MQVILLERIEKLGAPGAEVSVKRGYARNWLLPQGKAMLATDDNRKTAREQQTQISARDDAKKAEAETMREQLDGKEVILVRAAGESGQLYGSVRTHDIAQAVEEQLQVILSKKFVTLEEPVRSTGIFAVAVRLHPQVAIAVSINVAPSEDEAKRQALKRDRQLKKEQEKDDKESYQEKPSAAKAEDDSSQEEDSQGKGKTDKSDKDAKTAESATKKAAKESARAKEESAEKEESSKKEANEASETPSEKPAPKKVAKEATKEATKEAAKKVVKKAEKAEKSEKTAAKKSTKKDE